MPKLRVAVSHSCELPEAQRRVDHLIVDLEKDGTITEVRQRWDTDRNNFQCRVASWNISGAIFIYPDMLILLADLPSAALPFMSELEYTLKRRAEAALA